MTEGPPSLDTMIAPRCGGAKPPPFEKDAFLKRVPDSLAAVFAGRRRVLDITHDLYQVETHLIQRLRGESIAAEVDFETIRLLFETIRREILRNIPAYVCRRCRHRADVRCSCGGKRWLTQNESRMPGAIARLSQFGEH